MSKPNIEKDFAVLVSQLSKPGYTISQLFIEEPLRASLTHMALGLAGEAGEVIDTVRQYAIYGAPNVDTVNLVEELGDALFYIQGMANLLGVSLNEIQRRNMEKLAKRYPAGHYTDAHAFHRIDKTEDDCD